MAITINGVLCQEIARKDGLREEIDLLQGPSARKGYLCPWVNRYQVAQGLLGLTTATKILGQITLYYPAQYPEIGTIYCYRISIEPVGSPTQGTRQVQWPYCIVWAEYGRLPFFANIYNQIDPTHPLVFAEQRLSGSCEWITIPGKAVKFVSSGKLLTEGYGVRLALVEIEIAYKQVPYLPAAEVYSSAGHINSTTCLGVNQGQLLFNTMTSQTSTNYDGSYTQELVYSLTARSQRWDYALDPSTGLWDQVVTTGGSNSPLVTSSDLNLIFPTFNLVG